MGILADFQGVRRVYSKGGIELSEVHAKTGSLVWKRFVPYVDLNITVASKPVPKGCAGVLIKGTARGGDGGRGRGTVFNDSNGGGGGGGGGRWADFFIPVDKLASTYALVFSDAYVSFTSGNFVLRANRGGNGQTITDSGARANGGTGGTVSITSLPSGLSVPATYNGQDGGMGNANSQSAPDPVNSGESCPGGAGGGGRNAFGGTTLGGDGASSNYASGSKNAANPVRGGNATFDGDPGGGGGGANGVNGSAGSGGDGGSYGSGGGGSGGGNSTGQGGTGGPAYLIAAWLLDPP